MKTLYDQVKELEDALDRMKNLSLAMLNLMKPIASVEVPGRVLPHFDDHMGELIDLYLERAVQVLGDAACRASVWIPSQIGKKRYLVIWKCRNMPIHNLTEKRFLLVRNARDQEGVVGVAYLKRETQRGILTNDKGLWVCSHEKYVFHKRRNQEPDYKAFVAIPLLGPEKRCHGVLCFDSEDPTMFDGQPITDALETLADALAATLTLYNKLKSQGIMSSNPPS